jgi:hypothetical protein
MLFLQICNHKIAIQKRKQECKELEKWTFWLLQKRARLRTNLTADLSSMARGITEQTTFMRLVALSTRRFHLERKRAD